MAGFRIDASDAIRFAGVLDSTGASVAARLQQTVAHHLALLQTSVQRNASGRPGPNVITGDYRRSITRELSSAGLRAEGVVGTGAPQGRRLEYGFVGTDSLGRHYNQPPFPHFRPAADQIEGPFVASMLALVPL